MAERADRTAATRPVAWVVSDTGRVLRKASERPLPDLPRIWLPATADPLVGAVVADESASTVVLSRDAGRATCPSRSDRSGSSIGEISMTLSSGVEVILREAVATRAQDRRRRAHPPLASDARTIDVSVPERVVATESRS